MFQVSRDADHPHQGLKVNHSAGPLQVGCCLLGAARSEDARPCRGLQNRGTHIHDTPGRGASGCGVQRKITNRRTEGPASLSHKSPQRSIGDNLSMRAARQATFGDSGRQILGLQMRVGCGAFAGWGKPRCKGCSLEAPFITRLAEMGEPITLTATHAFMLMQSGSAGEKMPVITTKNDKSQNPQYSHQFRAGHASWLIDSSEEGRREVVAPRLRCRIKGIGVTTNERLHPVFDPEGPFRGSRFLRPIHSGVYFHVRWKPPTVSVPDYFDK